MKYLLVTKDGGIYRNGDGEPVADDDLNALKWYAETLYSLTDYRIVDYSLPWRVVEAPDEDGP